MELDQNQLLFFSKSWQGKSSSLIFQVQANAKMRSKLPKKFYLVIQTKQASKGVELRLKKPTDIKVQGVISQIIRKYTPKGVILNILRDKFNKDLWFLLVSGQGLDKKRYFLKLCDSQPPLLSFISESKLMHFRYGQSGVFTKKKEYEGGFPDFSDHKQFESIVDQAYSALAATWQQASMELEDSSKTALTDMKKDEASKNLESEQSTSFLDIQREARKKLARRLKTVVKSFEKQSKNIPSVQELESMQLKAKFLQSYSYLIAKNMCELVLDSGLTGLEKDLVIDIDPDLSAGANIDAGFVKIKKMTKARELGVKRLEVYRRQKDAMVRDLELLRSESLDSSQVVAILKKNGLAAPSDSKSNDLRSSTTSDRKYCKIFVSEADGGAQFWVGKGPADNDILTKKAKSNDYWFHVTGSTGSHIIVPHRSLKDGELTESLRRKGAMLAVHFSKLRAEASSEVYVSQRRFLRKKKGLPVGLWLVEQSQNYFVRYKESEINELLSSLNVK